LNAAKADADNIDVLMVKNSPHLILF